MLMENSKIQLYIKKLKSKEITNKDIPLEYKQELEIVKTERKLGLRNEVYPEILQLTRKAIKKYLMEIIKTKNEKYLAGTYMEEIDTHELMYNALVNKDLASYEQAFISTIDVNK